MSHVKPKKDKSFTNGVLITKKGIYYRWWYGSQKHRRIESYIQYLDKNVRIEEDVTFEDFFNPIMNNWQIYDIMFKCHLAGFNLGDWVNEWKKKDPEKEYPNQKVDYIEFYWIAEYNSKRSKLGIDIICDYHGVGRAKDIGAYNDDEWHDENFAFGFTPIHEYKHYPIKINEEFKIYDHGIKYDPKKPNKSYVFNSWRKMTLNDIIGALLYEMSFYGTPKMRNKERNKLNKMVEKIDKGEVELKELDLDKL